MFEEQYRGRQASLSSLGGALRLSGPTVLALVTNMQRQGLVSATGQTFSLTPEGKRLALQVVRAHRLLERTCGRGPIASA
jgi:Mn-dependent DtxR family transcriptional regulator